MLRRLLRLLGLFVIALMIGLWMAPGADIEKRRVRKRTWMEFRDQHITANAEPITRKCAERFLQRLASGHPALHSRSVRDKMVVRFLTKWTEVYVQAYSRLAPKKELLKQILQEEYGDLSPDEFSPIQEEYARRAAGAEVWPVSVEIDGRKRMLLVRMSDWPELFDHYTGGYRPERRVEEQIRLDVANVYPDQERGRQP